MIGKCLMHFSMNKKRMYVIGNSTKVIYYDGNIVEHPSYKLTYMCSHLEENLLV